MELEDYQKKQKLEGVTELKQELNQFPDITGQTQREGTLRENYIRPEISKSEYWSKTCEYTFDEICVNVFSMMLYLWWSLFSVPFGYDYDVNPGLSYQRADDFYEPIPTEDYRLYIAMIVISSI